jgi:hypothetical protein
MSILSNSGKIEKYTFYNSHSSQPCNSNCSSISCLRCLLSSAGTASFLVLYIQAIRALSANRIAVIPLVLSTSLKNCLLSSAGTASSLVLYMQAIRALSANRIAVIPLVLSTSLKNIKLFVEEFLDIQYSSYFLFGQG